MSTMISVVTILSAFLIVIYRVDSFPANKNFKSHYAHADSFKCHHPQPRAIRIKEEIVTGMLSKKVIPRMAVLYRCDSGTGCCLDGDEESVCGPVETEDVKLTFKVIYPMDTDTHKAGPHEETMDFKNHTRCGCISPE